MPSPFNTTVFVGKTSVEIREEPTSADAGERLFHLSAYGKDVGAVILSPYYWPKIAVHHPFVFAWAGLDLFYFDLGTLELKRRDLADELWALYPLTGGWCLICETSIFTLRTPDGEPVSTFSHDEVITKSWWEGSELRIEDFQGRAFRFDPTEDLILKPQS